MNYLRCYCTDIVTGIPNTAIIANEADPTDRVAVGDPTLTWSVETRWATFLEMGRPANLETLRSTLIGSYAAAGKWEPAGTDRAAAAEEAETIIAAGEVMVTPIAPPKKEEAGKQEGDVEGQ